MANGLTEHIIGGPTEAELLNSFLGGISADATVVFKTRDAAYRVRITELKENVRLTKGRFFYIFRGVWGKKQFAGEYNVNDKNGVIRKFHLKDISQVQARR